MKTILKKTVVGIALMLAGIARAAVPGVQVTFSSTGPDAYPDGTAVVDGEYYALAWADDDAKLVMGTDGMVAGGRVLAKVSVAEDRRCPPVNVKLDDETANACKDGAWGVFLLDTRGSTGDALTISSATRIANATVEVASNGFLSYAKFGPKLLSAPVITDGVTDNPAAAIGSTGYATLADAIAAATAGDTVTLIQDVTLDATLELAKSITLDLNGKTLSKTLASTSDTTPVIKALSGTVEIKNGSITYDHSTFTGTGSVSKPSVLFVGMNMSNGVYSYGDCNLTLNGVNVSVTFPSGKASMTMVYVESGKLNIVDSNLSATTGESNTKNQYMIYTKTHNQASTGVEVLIQGATILDTKNSPYMYAIWTQGTSDKLNISGDTTIAATGTKGYAVYSKYGACAIDGGTFKGRVYQDAGTITVSDGIFDREMSTSYSSAKNKFTLAEGVEYVENTDPATKDEYPYLVGAPASYVAQIVRGGDVVAKYETLADAVAAANDGDTVQLLKDVKLSDSLDVDSMFTLDLGGHVIAPAEGTTSSKKFTANSAHDYLIGVKYDGTLSIVDSVGGGAIDGSSLLTALKLTTKGEVFDGDTTADLIIGSEDEEGWNNFTVTGDTYGISGNGTRHGTSLYVFGGTVQSVNEQTGTGIYHPQDGVLVIQGGTIRGRNSAVEVRAGDASFWGGNYVVTGNSAYSSTANGSGTTAKGAAIAIAPHTTGRDLTVEVLDGNDASGASFGFTIPQGAVRFAVANPQNVDFDAVDVTVADLGDIFGDSYEIPAQYNWYYDNDMELFGLVKSVAERLDANGAHVGYYSSLADAIADAQDDDTVQLLADVDATGAMYSGDTRYNLWIDKSITVNGDGHVLTVKGRGVGVKGASGKIDVTFKDVTIANSSAGARCIDTRGNLNSLTLDHATLDTNGATSGYTQPLTIGGSQSDKATVSIVNGSKIQTNDEGTAYYAIITFNPVNMTIDDSTIKGWACIYAKGPDGSAGSAGSVFTITDSELVSKNVYSGESNAFAMLMAEDDNVTFNVTNTKIDVNATGDQSQAIVSTGSGSQATGVAANLGAGNEVTLSGEATFEGNTGSAIVSGGTFNVAVPEEACADGYIPAAQDPVTGKYTVKEGTYVAQNATTGTKYETLENAISAAESGDTVMLLMDIENFTGTQNIGKSLTLDGAGHKIVANADASGEEMFDVAGDVDVTIKNITVDGAHKYTYCIQAFGSGADLTLEDVTVLHGTKVWFGDFKYGAGVHVNGANLLLKGNFTAFSGGKTDESFPFTGILYEGGTILFADGATASIANPEDPTDTDLLLVGMLGALDVSDPDDRAQVEEMLEYMNVPAGFYPYTLKINPDEWNDSFEQNTSFTGASPLGWNDIIDYGKAIMDAISMDTAETPVEVGLLTDTVLPDTFVFEDSNFTVDGNGYALSGTIEYTDNAGLIHDIVMGTDDNALVLDMTGVTQPIRIGSGIVVDNVTVEMTAEQATAGTPVIIWDAAHGVDAPENEAGVSVVLVNDQGQPTSDTAELIWDDEMGMAYIGPVEARLTGPTHETPIYTTLANAIAWAEQTGDTVTLLMNVSNVTGTITIDKSLTLDGGSNTVSAAAVPADGHRNMVDAFMGGTSMLKIEGDVTLRNITLDGDATHRYTYLVSADNSSAKLTTSNVRLLNGGELAGDANGAILEQGAGYGAGIHLNNGAQLVVSNGFYACTGGPDDGVFPFTGILPEGGASVSFELTENPNDPANVDIGSDLLLVGMVGVIPLDQVQGVLNYMKVPSRFIPYTLTLGDGSAYAFTGASPRTWNDIIDYGKEIMDVSTAIGYNGLDKTSTPVEVGLLTDTVLPDTFRFADTNFTVNGNGNALAGTIEYTDNAGQIHDIVMGTEGNALVLDMTDTTKPIVIGSGITVSNVTVQMTAEQATAGTPVIIWDAEHGVDAPENEAGVTVQIVDDHGDSTGVTKELIWDDEMGMAYIGPCEARLTGPTHDKPIYTTLANAIEWAAQTGDTVTLLMNVTNVTATYEISKQDLVIDGAGYTVAAAPVTEHRNMFDAFGSSSSMFKVKSGSVTFKNIELDGDATHAYTYLVSADNSSVALTTENVRLIHGGEQSLDANGTTLTPGNGYGAAIHLNNGAKLTVKDGFYACTGTNVNSVTTGVFPFTAILPENLEAGTAVTFDLTGDTDATPTVDIGDDLLLVGMIGDLIDQYGINNVQGILDYMKVPSRFIPYTLTLGDGSAYAFTGASPRRWNEIIDYGKDIMDVSTAMGFSGLNKDTTPVEVGLATDTVLPAGADGDGYDFLYEDANFSINGNGNALSGTIKFTDDANGGLMHDIELGTEDAPLTLDLSATTNAVMLGGDVVISNVVVKLTEDQATLGKVVFEWDSGETPPDDEQGVEVTVVNNSGTPTGETKGLVWDEEYGVAYIGPVEARLTGTTHETPVYTSLANALDIAKDNDKVELLTNAVLSAVQGVGSDVTLDLEGYKVEVSGGQGLLVTNATLVIADTSVKTNGTICAGDEASPASLIESGNGGVVNIPTGIFVAASGQNVLVTSDNGAIAVSGGYFSNPVLSEHCAESYMPVDAEAGAPQPYMVAEFLNEFRYPIDGSVGVPVERTWLAQNFPDIYSDSTKPVLANVTNALVQALSENGENEMPRWESYVLGLDPTDVTARLRLTATSKDAATVTIIGLIDMTKFPKPEGTTITFRLAEVNPDGTKKADLVTDSEEPSFDVLLEEVVGKELAIFADIAVEAVAK